MERQTSGRRERQGALLAVYEHDEEPQVSFPPDALLGVETGQTVIQEVGRRAEGVRAADALAVTRQNSDHVASDVGCAPPPRRLLFQEPQVGVSRNRRSGKKAANEP
ncbi:MAG TPA: hypothetical protein VHX67_03945 [Acidimicrobiales bacterium]|jgi:hypothetical protein|nr:hypothetical protein [Acidimicrobiales bacterium]